MSLDAQVTSSFSRYYQEGFMAKYSRAGVVKWVKAVGFASPLAANETGMLVSQLRIVGYKASTSNKINTQLKGLGASPNLPTQTSRKDIEYDNGVAQGAVQGGTGTESTITLKTDSSSTDKWYNGLLIQIVDGPGIKQTRTIYEYNGATKVARVHPHWDAGDTPAVGSRYTILGGRPSSWISGMHWSNGGVYVSGRINTVCGLNCSLVTSGRGAISVKIGEMPTAYRDSNAQTTPKFVQALLGQDDHQNFLAQFDVDGKVFWSRFIGNNGVSGTVTAVTNVSVFNVAADASTIDNFYVGCSSTIIDETGAGAGQTRVISSYTGATRTVTVATSFGNILSTTSRYIIANKGTTGTVVAGSTTTVTLQSSTLKNSMDGIYNGSSIVITGGTGEGQVHHTFALQCPNSLT
jgi:hypothetical protein